jgi:hypothetical protein
VLGFGETCRLDPGSQAVFHNQGREGSIPGIPSRRWCGYAPLTVVDTVMVGSVVCAGAVGQRGT